MELTNGKIESTNVNSLIGTIEHLAGLLRIGAIPQPETCESNIFQVGWGKLLAENTPPEETSIGWQVPLTSGRGDNDYEAGSCQSGLHAVSAVDDLAITTSSQDRQRQEELPRSPSEGVPACDPRHWPHLEQCLFLRRTEQARSAHGLLGP